jgi:hypothetical protein
MNLIQKLIEVRKSCSYLKKENKGAQYQYVSSSQTLASLKSKMDELGLLLVPKVIGHKVSESTVEQHDKDTGVVTKRTTTYFTELDMEYTWINADKPEETLSSTWYGQGVDIAGEKGTGKAMTYAEKYFMLKFFNIPTDKDDPDSFQKKHDDGKGNEEEIRQAVDALIGWVDNYAAPGALDKNKNPVTKDSITMGWHHAPDVLAWKKKLDAENLKQAEMYFKQILSTIFAEKKAA